MLPFARLFFRRALALVLAMHKALRRTARGVSRKNRTASRQPILAQAGSEPLVLVSAFRPTLRLLLQGTKPCGILCTVPRTKNFAFRADLPVAPCGASTQIKRTNQWRLS